MTSSPDRPVAIQLVVRSAHPALLEGLDSWLRLGLISDSFVRQLCAEQLTCTLPTAPAVEPDFAEKPAIATHDFLPVSADLPPTRPRPEPRPVGLVGRAMQSFMAEISVVWLLFLGVFLVVVSSGVLAATQWRNVSSVGQYGILFGYTLLFWVATIALGRQPALQLTARMLNITTLLIIPVNFWMMDGFRLWGRGAGLAVSGLAAAVLTGITYRFLRASRPRWMIGVAIALSWLHWGWSGGGFPFLAVYAGTLGAAITLLQWDNSLAAAPPASPVLPAFSLTAITIAASALLLLSRAALTGHVPIAQLGLAMGVCGWVVCWLARRDSARAVWNWVGTGLLGLGWAISVSGTSPWQAIAISGLGIWLLSVHLRRSSHIPYLTALVLIGLQILWLLWRVIPVGLQGHIIQVCGQWTGGAGLPWALIGLGAFPYVLGLVVLGQHFRRWQHPALAWHSEQWALGLGVALTVISSLNPVVRSLNLVLSTLTLIGVLRRRDRPSTELLYLTHGTTLAAIASLIHWRFPALNGSSWAAILIFGMLGEWGVSVLTDRDETEMGERAEVAIGHEATREIIQNPKFKIQNSKFFSSLVSWHFGLLFAALSYSALWNELFTRNLHWGWLWLATPLALALLGTRPRFWAAQWASWLSIGGLVLLQPLMFSTVTERLVNLGMATLVMLVNTRQVRQGGAAAISLGFGLAFVGTALSDTVGTKITFPSALGLFAIASLLLWSLRGWLRGKPNTLARLYRRASDGWAITLALFVLFALSLAQLLVYFGAAVPDGYYGMAALVLLVATGYRTWQGSRNLALLAAAWSLELAIASFIALQGRSLDSLGITNLVLGLGTQLAGDLWVEKRRRVRDQRRRGAEAQGSADSVQNSESRIENPSPSSFIRSTERSRRSLYPVSFHVIPLAYALLGVLIQHHAFTATTGLYTLAATLTGIGVGRRQSGLQPIAVLSTVGVSLSAFECLSYQLSQAKGGSPGDGMIVFAALAIGLAIAVQVTQRWLIPYLRLAPPVLQAIAHLHWLLSSLLLIFAPEATLSSAGTWLWDGILLIVAAYALAMGRRQGHEDTIQSFPLSSPSSRPLWIYAGLCAGLVAVTDVFHHWLSDALLIDWAGTIAAALAVLLYGAPWQRWGWDERPGRTIAASLPGVAVGLTAWGGNLQSVLIVAAFYAGLANAERRIRLSYISVILAGWAVLRWLNDLGASELLWYAAIAGVALLYIAQVDPSITAQPDREKRHWLRNFATALICLTAFYQSQLGIVGIGLFWVGVLAIAIQLGFILAGLFLRIRAFLYIGTVTFLLQVFWQRWRFIAEYPLRLWALGILLGLALIWIAATFEARRAQVNALLNHWMTELEGWD